MKKTARSAPLGVMDSGVGGLTVVRRLRALMPGEDILYYADNANAPYGNHTREELIGLNARVLRYFVDCGVKAVVVACNTSSCVLDALQPACSVPLIGIVDPVVRELAAAGLKRVGLVATAFTVASGCYERRLRALLPDVSLIAADTRTLGDRIDRGNLEDPAIDAEISRMVNSILARGDVRHLILGCTHYPIVADHFRRLYPGIACVDPARAQARAVRALLAARDLLSFAPVGRLRVYTSGDPRVYPAMIARLGIAPPEGISRLCL